MKIKICIIAVIAIVMGGCTSPKYLPKPDKIDVNEYGSYIKIIHKTATRINGELIAIDSNRIVVLTEGIKICVSIPLTEVKRFSLKYASSKHYGWTIPVFSLATISHGLGLIITAPVNLIVTTCVTANGEMAFKYSDKNMTYDQLKMFARFPQGIPPGIDLPNIK